MGDLTGVTVVFDLDGTLVDTAPDLLRVLDEVLAAEGVAAPPAGEMRLMIGRGARVLIERAGRAGGRTWDDARLDALTEEFVRLYAADIARESRPFPNTVAALDELQRAGAILAVCTNKRTGLSVQLLEALGLAHRFAAIVGADAVNARKPAAEHFLATVAAAGGDPSRAVMIGDGAPDVGAARAAAAPAIAVRFGYCEEGVEALAADAVIDDFAELVAAVRALVADGPGGSPPGRPSRT
jgi:phosphoglycolate phosphatase